MSFWHMIAGKGGWKLQHYRNSRFYHLVIFSCRGGSVLPVGAFATAASAVSVKATAQPASCFLWPSTMASPTSTRTSAGGPLHWPLYGFKKKPTVLTNMLPLFSSQPPPKTESWGERRGDVNFSVLICNRFKIELCHFFLAPIKSL